jgi:hypothetical protein
MSSGVSWNVKICSPTWRTCLCLLLALLVLYNPFASLNGSCAKLSYEKCASRRATIGSGELQHFSPVSNESTQSSTFDVDVSGVEPSRCTRESYPLQRDSEVIPKEVALLAGIWFRPPPLS